MSVSAETAVPNCDVVIRSGQVFDGAGTPAVSADLAIDEGKVQAVGPRLPQRGRREIDAAGCWVIPGMLDIHTHYDAEIEALSGLEESVRHGVTTVVMGNCSLSAALGSKTDVLDLFCRVEGLPREVLSKWLGDAMSAHRGHPGHAQHGRGAQAAAHHDRGRDGRENRSQGVSHRLDRRQASEYAVSRQHPLADAGRAVFELLRRGVHAAVRGICHRRGSHQRNQHFLFAHDTALPGFNDSGAHARNMAFQYGGLQMLQQVLLNPDVIVVDPQKLQSGLGPPIEHYDERLHGAMRMVKRSDGVVRQVFVGGRMAFENGRFVPEFGRERFGRLLRSQR